jgi:hypothetical protein
MLRDFPALSREIMRLFQESFRISGEADRPNSYRDRLWLFFRFTSNSSGLVLQGKPRDYPVFPDLNSPRLHARAA